MIYNCTDVYVLLLDTYANQ